MTPSSWQWLTTSTIFLKICAACTRTKHKHAMKFFAPHVHSTHSRQHQLTRVAHLPVKPCAGLGVLVLVLLLSHLALSKVLSLHDVVKQLAPLAQLHDDVDVVLVLMGALQAMPAHGAAGALAAGQERARTRSGQLPHASNTTACLLAGKVTPAASWHRPVQAVM